MPPGVRPRLNARPRLLKHAHGHARVNLALGRARADLVVDRPVDAVIGDLVSRTQRVGVVGEGPVRDASAWGHAVAAEAVDRVEKDGGAEGAGVALFGPVADKISELMGIENLGVRGSRLVACVVALCAESDLVGVHQHAVEWEERSLAYMLRTRS